MMNHGEKTGITTWCLGLPLQGERLLTAAEHAAIQRIILRSGLTILGCMIALGLSLLVILFTPLLWVSGGQTSPAAVLLPLLALAALPTALLIGYRRLHLYRALWKDLDSGTLRQYTGQLDPNLGQLDQAIARLLRSHQLRPCQEAEQSIEALPHSGLIWSINGQQVRQRIFSHPKQIADVPEYARLAAEWLDPISPQTPATHYAGQRELSQPEREEILQLRHQLFLRPIFIHLGFAVWLFCVGLNFLTERPDALSATDKLLLGGVFFFALRSGHHAITCARIAKRLSHDHQLGRVVITRALISMSDATPALPILSDPQETLVASGLPWSENGLPASWRYIRSR